MAIENRIGKVKINKKGFLMDFDNKCIEEAILKAAREVDGLVKNIDPDSVYAHFSSKSEEFIAQALTEDVILCLNMQKEYRSPHRPPSLDEIHDTVIDVLMDRGFERVSSSYSIYREGQNALRLGWLKKRQFAGNGYPKTLLKQREKWCKKQGIQNIKDLNEKIHQGKFLELVSLDTERYEQELQKAVSQFEKKFQQKKIKVMIIAGPSSSGKTTTCKKLSQYLHNRGYTFKILEVDNYFFSSEEYPRDWFGDMDNELPESIDLCRLNKDLESLIKGEAIYPPMNNFKIRTTSQEPFQLKENEILLLDCLHGLYPPTTEVVLNNLKFKVYIETYPGLFNNEGKSIKFTDIRMLRRMCRDVRDRGYTFQYTLEHWATVRKGDFKGIVPYILTADACINGALLYDLPTLKYQLYNNNESPFQDQILAKYKERGRLDAYRRGIRVKKLLEQVELPTTEEIKKIPKDNLIREFIGQ
ncbi:MAG TPA: hypothetical protein PLR86_01755 [Planctomycetota bacterium]|nr:hypothetical protein [Planctomycetota bacterium]